MKHNAHTNIQVSSHEQFDGVHRTKEEVQNPHKQLLWRQPIQLLDALLRCHHRQIALQPIEEGNET